MDERVKFVLEALEGWVPMSALCQMHGVGRRVGYKWLARYEEGGLQALADRPRVPKRQAQQTAPELVAKILELRAQRPTRVGYVGTEMVSSVQKVFADQPAGESLPTGAPTEELPLAMKG